MSPPPHRVKSWWSPPTLLARQAGSLLLLAGLARWHRIPAWLSRYAIPCLPGASGARGMGCIGFPSHPVIELTSRCNLSCIHCHARAGDAGKAELSTQEVCSLLDQLAGIHEFRMVAFTGGEPLLRDDLIPIIEYARDLGFSTTLATNGTLVSPAIARRLADAGLAIAAISLDATDPATHDGIRGKPGALEQALAGVEAVKEAGIPLHINVTIASYNADQLPSLIREADRLGAAILIVYQLVPVGRGSSIADKSLSRESNRKFIQELADGQSHARVVIEPVAGPQYWAYLLHRAGIDAGPGLSLSRHLFHGCAAGRGFVYIKPDGTVLPCPFIPVSCGNIRDTPFEEIYRDHPVFQALRDRDQLTGSCGSCQYRMVCGGCRGRAFAMTGSYLAEDPACFIRDPTG